MKFWKIVRKLIEQWLPDWRDKFLSYKALKKQLKIIYPDSDSCDGQTTKRHRLDPDLSVEATATPEISGGDSGEVVDFVKLLDGETDKLNVFFVKKLEEYLQRWMNLPDKIAEARESRDRFELMKMCREVIDFHGEMVLLENYSAINYIGLVKIVKKYDKRSGNIILLPFIQKLQKQPFFSTDVLNTLVNNCGTALDHLFFDNADQSVGNGVRDETVDEENEEEDDDPEEILGMDRIESKFFKLVQLALKVLKEIRSGSSTKSAFSLPPMQD